jgi:hypothetical protein
LSSHIIFDGDSMTGDSGGGTSSGSSRFARTTLTNLGANWSAVVLATQGETVVNMATNAITEIDPYIPDWKTGKNILVIWGGTNDLANNATGATLRTTMAGYCTARKGINPRLKIIIVGVCARGASFSGGQTQVGYDTARTAYHSLMLTDFSTVSAVTNVFTPAAGIVYADAFVNIAANAIYNNPNDITYFQSDLIHGQNAMYDDLSNTYVTPTINNVITVL